MAQKIDKLSINSPYEEPRKRWVYDRLTRTFSKEEGRRPAGEVVANSGLKKWSLSLFKKIGRKTESSIK